MVKFMVQQLKNFYFTIESVAHTRQRDERNHNANFLWQFTIDFFFRLIYGNSESCDPLLTFSWRGGNGGDKESRKRHHTRNLIALLLIHESVPF
jgi:hypothetical protein